MSTLLTEPRTQTLTQTDERTYVEGLIRLIVEKCPRRKSASRDERRAQEILASELQAQGLTTELIPFQFNNSLYAVLALHFGLATLASLMVFYSPLLAFALHVFVAVSYFGDSTYAYFWLRRLLPQRTSQNLVATLPAAGPVRQRVVLVGHADAAPHGWMFRPQLVKGATNNYYPRPFRFLRKQLAGAMLAILTLAFLDLLVVFPTGRTMPLLWVGLTLACAIPLVLNLQLLLRNNIVPGASDNLTGCAALPVLAARFAEKKPDDVELVFVATGCEEAGCGGSLALARGMLRRWEKHNTTILGLDILTNGELRYKQCGEIVPLPVAPWLYDTIQDVAADDPRWGKLRPFNAPAGSDDVAPFLAHGYQGVCLCSIDPELGVSRHYHCPSDTPDNLEYAGLMDSLDYAEKLIDGIIARRRSEAIALAEGRTVLPPRGEPKQPYFPRVLRGWHVGLLLGPLAGAYFGGMAQFAWDTSFVVFRVVWTIFLLTFPVFLLLKHLGRDPDRSRIAQVYVFVLLAALGTTFAGLAIHPLGQGLIAAWELGGPLARTLALGAMAGGLVGVAAAVGQRSRN